MQMRPYGAKGPEVSALGFGVMRLPPRGRNPWGKPNFTTGVPVIRHALELGVNFLDTHHNYHNGLSEVAIGKALKGWQDKVVIQSKTPFYREEPLAFFQKLVEEALEKMGVGRIDYLLFHSMSMDMFKKRGKGFFKLTDWAMKKGLILHRGFSSHDPAANIKTFIDTGEFSAMLVSYNWLDPGVAEAIAHAADKGMGVSVMNPVGGGSLSADTAQIRRLLPGSSSPSETALRYVLSTPGVCLALSGMNTNAQVDENVAIASRKSWMTSAQRKAMIGRVQAIHAKGRILCTACGYCMPCPHGVNIPENFMLLNRAKLFGLTDFARKRYAGLAGDKKGDRSARACQECGKCLPKCPNKVAIIAQLRQVAQVLGAKK